MGSSLRRQLREALPPSIKGLPRAVALEIADDARYDDAWRYDPENGRRSKVRLAELVRWTASKNERVVRDALRNLSLAGWEFRLPMGKDKKGALLYAVPGRALEFRVPDFEAPTAVGPDTEGTVTTGPIGTVTTGPSPEGVATTAEGPVTTAEGPVVTAEGPVTTVAATVTTGPPSPISSSSRKESPSSSPVVEAVDAVTEAGTTEGGGGGEIPSSEEQDTTQTRAEAVIDALDYRGKPPGLKRRQALTQRVAAALAAGWTERGLRRYLDISDDLNVRSAVAVYAHRLKEDELPDASVGDVQQLPPACIACLRFNPAAAHDVSLRVDPTSWDGKPCPDCHPDSVGRSPEIPEACQACREENPAARTNIRLRFRIIDGNHQACPDCHPKRIAFLAGQNGTGARAAAHTAADYASSSVDDLYGPRVDTADGGMWNRAMVRAQARGGTDAKVAGWMAISQRLAAEERQTYSNPEDQSVYDEPFWPEDK
ncbi:hypothetical protein ACIPMW_34505 [Streptomyces sp. NPDC086669]|uniref:hypothetical protein n=1 Tax=Streptomyces sp. NPDC086669 TaxID=3365753 RepID=UPI00381AE9D1